MENLEQKIAILHQLFNDIDSINNMKQQLLDLIANGKLKEALDWMWKTKDTQNSYFKDDLVGVLSRYNRNQNNRNAGEIALNDYQLECNLIERSVKMLLDAEFDENKVPANVKIPAVESTKLAPTVIATLVVPTPIYVSAPTTKKINILMLTALPAGMMEVDVNKEIARIAEKLQEKPDAFAFVVKRGVNQDEFKEITETRQPDILHFSGHGIDGGEQGGLVLQNEEKNGYELLSPEKLEILFEYFKSEFQIEAVLLNACLSYEQAAAIAKQVPYVAGTTVEIKNDHSVAFSVGFYFKLAQSKRDYRLSFASGRTQAALKGAKKTDFVFYKNGKIWDIG